MTEQPWGHHPGGETPPGPGASPHADTGPSGPAAPSPFPAPSPSPFPPTGPSDRPRANPSTPVPAEGSPAAGTWGAPPAASSWGAPPPGAWGSAPPPAPGPQPGWGDQPARGPQPGWGDQPVWGAPAGHPGAPGPGQGGYGGGPQLWSARPKPGIIPLRPIRLGEIFDGAFQAIRSNPRTMIGFSAIVVAITSLLSVVPQAALFTSLSGNDLLDPDTTAVDPGDLVSLVSGVASATVPSAVIKALALTLLNGLLIVAVSSAVLGRRMTPTELWHRARPRILRLVGLAFLVNAAISLPLLIALVPGGVVLATGEPLTGVLLLVGGLLLGIVAWAYLTTRWAFAGPALLLEDQRVVAALRRSWTLTQGSFWRTFLILVLLTNIIVAAGAGMLTMPFSVLSSLVGLTQSAPYASFTLNLAQLGIVAVGEIIAYSVFYPFQAAVTALLYIDLRMRTEGLDLELIRATEEGTPA